MEKLLQYFMEETNRKFDSVSEDVKDIKDSLSDLQKFKIEMLSSARATSFIVSMVCGLVTLSISVVVAYYSVKQ